VSDPNSLPASDHAGHAQLRANAELAAAELRAAQAEAAAWRLRQALALLFDAAITVNDQHDDELGSWQSEAWRKGLEAARAALVSCGAKGGGE